MSNLKFRAPNENFVSGIKEIIIPELGEAKHGKVRDIWEIDTSKGKVLIIGVSDRLSAFDSIICTIKGKGTALNQISAYWFDKTKEIIPNHMMQKPEPESPNVMICKKADSMIPIEVVVRQYMVRTASSTSIFFKYEKGERNIYGIKFPEDIKPNQLLPMGPIITPTTKAEQGHDANLTNEEARSLVNERFGNGIWEKVSEKASELFKFASKEYLSKGIILADTKFEFGVLNNEIILCDEAFTSDCSRLWDASIYEDRLKDDANPTSFDKEVLRRWLAENGFKGDGEIPVVPQEILEKVSEIYSKPYELITGKKLPPTKPMIEIAECAYNTINNVLNA